MERVHEAVQRQRELSALITKYLADVAQTKGLAELIEAEEALRTPTVGDGVALLRTIGTTLQTQLTKMAAVKGPIRRFFKQLVSGKGDQAKLEDVMKDLGKASQYLTLCTQVSNVGLTRGIGKDVKANAVVVEALNNLLVEKLGPGRPLAIAQLLEGRPRNGTMTFLLDVLFMVLQ